MYMVNYSDASVVSSSADAMGVGFYKQMLDLGLFC